MTSLYNGTQIGFTRLKGSQETMHDVCAAKQNVGIFFGSRPGINVAGSDGTRRNRHIEVLDDELLGK